MACIVWVILIIGVSRVYASNDSLSEIDSLSEYINWLLSTADNDTEFADSLGILHCNMYCNRSTENHIIQNICVSTTPVCRPCYCDEDCNKYGDCCPDEKGVSRMEKGMRYECVSTGQASYLMTAVCPDGLGIQTPTDTVMPSPDDMVPVTSVTSNTTYINKYIAACHGDASYKVWTKETFCKSPPNGTDSNPENNTSSCPVFIYPPLDVQVRICNPLFSDANYIDSCNATGLWNGSTFDIDVDVQCEEWYYYPVADGGYVFKNIYCFLCNGLTPSVQLCQMIPMSGIISINKLVRFGTETPTCSEMEWYDKIKNVCRFMMCRQGYELIDGDCVMIPTSLSSVQYIFDADLRLSSEYPNLKDWKELEALVVHNIPDIFSRYNISEYFLTMHELTAVNRNSSVRLPSFRLNLNFNTMQNCCRFEFERRLSDMVVGPWIMIHNETKYKFSISEVDFYGFDITESHEYKNIPPDVIPVKTNTSPFEYNGPPKLYIYLPVIYVNCSFVYLSEGDFLWNDDKSITLSYANITIQPENFTEQKEKLAICVNTLVMIYKDYQTPVDPMKRAESIVSLIFSVLSLVCLTLTFITYCTFPSLLTLPTKNTMCLVVSLFVAQLLLQFMDLASRDETTCKVIGVLLHYSWLSVILWMNVCSYHMFHVFVIDAAKPVSIEKRHRRHLRYFIYANGTWLIIVAITVVANLAVTSGNQIGYGNGTCYLSTAFLTGVAFVLPLGIVLILNITFFSITVWTIAKINKMSATIGQDKSQVYVYIKLSTLTGIFWTLSILAENLHLQFLVFISIILNASQGVFIFFSYMANRRVYQLWKGKCLSPKELTRTSQTFSTQL